MPKRAPIKETKDPFGVLKSTSTDTCFVLKGLISVAQKNCHYFLVQCLFSGSVEQLKGREEKQKISKHGLGFK